MRKLIFILLMCPAWLGAQTIPTKEQVGPQCMPAEIQPVEAPFKMDQPVQHDFGSRQILVKLQPGIKATRYIQEAIDEMARQGGGTVVIPQGTWATGRLNLGSGVNLNIPQGAELAFSGDIADYQPAVFTRDEGIELYSTGACIYANQAENIAITGKGVISGPSVKCEIYKRNSETVSDIENTVVSKRVDQRIYDGIMTPEIFLPKTISPINCKNVLVEGVTLRNTLYWNIVPQYCENVVIRGVTVESHGHGRTDGIDIESSKNVLVEYCSLDCGDDCYTIKSGRGTDGVRINRPTENVVIRYSLAKRGSGGLVCGSETAGNIKNIYMHDCVFDGTGQAFRFKSRRTRGGGIDGVFVERVKADVLRQAVYVDMLGSEKWMGMLSRRKMSKGVTADQTLIPQFMNISIHDIEIVNCQQLIDIHALPESPLKNIFIGNVRAKCQKLGKAFDATKLSVKDITVVSQDSVFYIDNCDYASFFGFNNQTLETPVNIKISGGKCRYLNIQNFPLHPVTYHSIRPGEVWLDTEGNPIQAHAGQIVWHDGKYYWYGEDKSRTLFGTNWMFCGVRCYSSTDFYNWKNEGNIILPSTDRNSPIHYSQKLERPHILRSPKTGKWVCWLKAQANNGYFVILEADSLKGPYRYVRMLRPEGYAVGDFDMYSDPKTGQGYVWFERPHWETICSELSDDYLDVNGNYSEHFVGLVPPYTREASAHFMMDGRHYMYTSGTTGYTPNESEIAVFDDYHGEYRVMGNPHVDDPFKHSFSSQISCVVRISGKNLYVAVADRWQPHTFRTDIPKQEFKNFERRYKGHRPYPKDTTTPEVTDRFYTLVNSNQDVYKATYVVLPVVIKDNIPMIEWKQDWRLEDYQ